ncbi:MAG: hypothetical protein JJ863_04735 [Deltaproteobacteria bacterium]|nr:hypothetical protein [Deltaproteobacteria bacterium]
MIHTNPLSAIRHTGLAISLLLAVGGCAAGGPGASIEHCDDCGPSVLPERPSGAALDRVPRLDVHLDEDAALSATIGEATLRVRPGMEATLEVRVDRAGFDGEIAVWAEGLPAGLVAEPAVMPGSVPTGRLVVSATESAAIGGPHAFRVVVSASDAEPIDVPARVVVTDAPGAFDRTFGAEGIVAVEGLSVGLRSVAVDDQARVVVAGRDWDTKTMMLERLDASGALDSAYAEAARDAFPPEDFSIASRMVLVGDEAHVLVVAGSHDDTEVQVGLMSFDAAGVPLGVTPINRVDDDAVGSLAIASGDGSVFLRVGERFASMRADRSVVELSLPAGAVTAHAMAYWNHTLTFGARASIDAPAMLERVHTAGGRDDRFGADGFVLPTDAGDEGFGSRITFLVEQHADGSGYAGSNAFFPERDTFGDLVRFTAEGALDATFGDGGVVTFESGQLLGLAVDGEGRPVVMVQDRSSGEREVRRYTREGELDRSFGEAGVLELGTTDLSGATLLTRDAVADRLVLCGATDSGWSCGRLWL